MSDIEQQKQAQSRGWEVLTSIAEDLEIGMLESDAAQMAAQKLSAAGITQIWHPTVIKFDGATMLPGVRHKACDTRALKQIAYIDLGVVIDGMEVDCGQSFGFSPEAKQIAQSASDICHEMIAWALLNKKETCPKRCYEEFLSLVEKSGYSAVSPTAGHRLGPYPTKKKETKISLKDATDTFESGAWMLEAHISNGSIGAFHEELFFV